MCWTGKQYRSLRFSGRLFFGSYFWKMVCCPHCFINMVRPLYLGCRRFFKKNIQWFLSMGETLWFMDIVTYSTVIINWIHQWQWILLDTLTWVIILWSGETYARSIPILVVFPETHKSRHNIYKGHVQNQHDPMTYNM